MIGILTSCFFYIIISDPAEQVWVWNYEGEKMYMDIDEPIRFRVLRELFTDTTPTHHSTPGGSNPAGRRQSVADVSASNDLAANSTKIPPYALTVSDSYQYYILVGLTIMLMNSFFLFYFITFMYIVYDSRRRARFTVLVG